MRYWFWVAIFLLIILVTSGIQQSRALMLDLGHQCAVADAFRDDLADRGWTLAATAHSVRYDGPLLVWVLIDGFEITRWEAFTEQGDTWCRVDWGNEFTSPLLDNYLPRPGRD